MQKFLRLTALCIALSSSFVAINLFPHAQAAEGDMTRPDFMFNVNNLSPTENKYENGTKMNIKDLLSKVGTTLLIVIPMLAVLFIVVGGIMMATASMGGKDGQFSKGKTIIVFNITAVALSLLSYSIIQLIAWVLQIR